MERPLQIKIIDTQKLQLKDISFLNHCIDLIIMGMTDYQFGVELLAEKMKMSHSTLYKKVKNLSGCSVNELIRLVRLEKASELLLKEQYTVKKVANKTGFNDLKYFRRHFKRIYNMSPSTYKKKNQQMSSLFISWNVQSFTIWKEDIHLKMEDILPICPS